MNRNNSACGVLAIEPQILVLDEPTTFLDPPGQRDLVKLLHDLPQAKILVAHDVHFAQSLASRAVFFEKGKVVDEGTVADVAARRNWAAGRD